MTKEELSVYNYMLNQIEKSSTTLNAGYWLERLEKYVIILNLKESKAIPLDEYELP